MQSEQTGPIDETPSESKWVPRLIPPFGQVDDFWKRYDTLADKKDKEMLQSLNSNLDVLLIFAGLFSAINTAFISLTMPELSPDATSETNTLLRLLVMRADNNTLTAADLSPPFSPESGSVAANCLLYASLCCSLLAAMGAMLGKEWLQSYGRSGQAGPLEEQARFRQQKFTGAQGWHLESIIGFLPNLLLVSVLLFFAGLVIFLTSVNVIVARVVIALVGSGVALGCATIVASTSYPSCPYQTALSRGLRRIAELVPRVIRVDENNSENAAKQSQYQTQDDILNGHAASWLLEATSDPIDQLAIVRNIYGLGASGISVILTSPSLDRLTSLATKAIQRGFDRPDEAGTRLAYEFGTALGHVLRRGSDRNRMEGGPESLPWPTYLGLPENMRCLWFMINDSSGFPHANMIYPAKLVFLEGCLVRNDDLRWDNFEILLSDLYDDTLLAMIACHICKNLPQDLIADVPGFEGTVSDPLDWNAYSGAMLLPNLVVAFSAGPGAWATIGHGASTERVLKVYNTLFKRIQVALESEPFLFSFQDKFGAAIEAGFCEIFRTPEFALAKDPIDFIPVVLKVFQIMKRLRGNELPTGWDSAYLTTLWSAVNAVVRDPRLPTNVNLRDNAEDLNLQIFRWIAITAQLDGSAVILNSQPETFEYLSSCLQRKATDPSNDYWLYFLDSAVSDLASYRTRGLQSLWLDHGLSNVIISLFRTSRSSLRVCRADAIPESLCRSSTPHSRKLACDGIVDVLLTLMQRVDEERELSDQHWEVAQNTLLRRIILIWMEAFDTIKWTSGGWLPAMNRTLVRWSQHSVRSCLDSPGHVTFSVAVWHSKLTISCVSLMAFLYDLRAQLPASDLEACDFHSTINRFDSLFQEVLGCGPVLYGDAELPSPCYRIHFGDDRLL